MRTPKQIADDLYDKCKFYREQDAKDEIVWAIEAERKQINGLREALNEIKNKMAQPPDRISKITIRDYSVLRLSILRIADEAQMGGR